MTATPPISRGRKFDQVIEGARRVFMRDGFEGSSVDEIARESGVSKATLYSYFPDKRLMFMEVFRAELTRESTDASALIDADLPVEHVLPVAVQMIMAHMLSDFGLRTYRISVAESERFPVLSREYYEAGPGKVGSQIAAFLDRACQRGELNIPETERRLAADALVHMSGIHVHDRALFLSPDAVDGEAQRKVADMVTRMFLSVYGAKSQTTSEPQKTAFG